MKISQIKVTEILVLDKADVMRRQDGSIIANPRVGRIGIQLYKGDELGRPDMKVVRVWRPESEVMHKAAMSSITHKAVTNDHPPEPVTRDNWKKYAVGHTGDEVARDGDFIRVPMMISDGAAIDDFDNGKKELSLGYVSALEWRTGATPQGEQYDAVQTNIRVNHLALVDAARGGAKLAIGDATVSINQQSADMAKKWIADRKFSKEPAPDPAKTIAVLCLASQYGGSIYPFAMDGIVYRAALQSIKAQAATDQQVSIEALADELINLIDAQPEKRKMDPKMTTIVVDGIPCEMSDISAAHVQRRLSALSQEAGDLSAKLAASNAKEKDALTKAQQLEEEKKKKEATDAATIATLKQQLADAQMTPAKLDALVRDRAQVVGRARVVLGDKLIVDGKTDGEMRRQVVDSKLGDTAKDWSDDSIKASFDTLTADIKPEQITAADGMRKAFNGKPNGGGNPGNADHYTNYDKRLQDAWKQPKVA